MKLNELGLHNLEAEFVSVGETCNDVFKPTPALKRNVQTIYLGCRNQMWLI